MISASINADNMDYSIFLDYKELTTVIIGKNVKGLGYEIFNSCSNIISITYLGTMDEWNSTIGKTSSWKNGNSSITKIICSDGEINL